MALISVNNLTVGYENMKLFDNLSFKVEQGDYLCIVGENGSGKTTLMKSILGLHQGYDGEIIFSDGLKREEIGYLPQQTQVQKDFPASVREIVLSGNIGKRRFSPFYKKEDKLRAEKNMEILEISHLANRCYRELSGGQQQRVLLARALCATEKVLLLDEPVSGLDPKVSKTFYEIIENLNKSGITIIMISHSIPDVINYANQVLYIGNKTFFGTKKEYINSNFYMNLSGEEKSKSE